ncbi:hypothetical protein P7K49_026556 [Saguinus oedipus]|uniref:Uncharacterized protein n=1 Tax=Saguinus oedipus TaxID=9490 RepID=A0ABQ9UEC8_SAGOE|nr:hypothetical protein P7K49_026556 [Saguinus oedipus]
MSTRCTPTRQRHPDFRPPASPGQQLRKRPEGLGLIPRAPRPAPPHPARLPGPPTSQAPQPGFLKEVFPLVRVGAGLALPGESVLLPRLERFSAREAPEGQAGVRGLPGRLGQEQGKDWGRAGRRLSRCPGGEAAGGEAPRRLPGTAGPLRSLFSRPSRDSGHGVLGRCRLARPPSACPLGPCLLGPSPLGPSPRPVSPWPVSPRPVPSARVPWARPLGPSPRPVSPGPVHLVPSPRPVHLGPSPRPVHLGPSPRPVHLGPSPRPVSPGPVPSAHVSSARLPSARLPSARPLGSCLLGPSTLGLSPRPVSPQPVSPRPIPSARVPSARPLGLSPQPVSSQPVSPQPVSPQPVPSACRLGRVFSDCVPSACSLSPSPLSPSPQPVPSARPLCPRLFGAGLGSPVCGVSSGSRCLAVRLASVHTRGRATARRSNASSAIVPSGAL